MKPKATGTVVTPESVANCKAAAASPIRPSGANRTNSENSPFQPLLVTPSNELITEIPKIDHVSSIVPASVVKTAVAIPIPTNNRLAPATRFAITPQNSQSGYRGYLRIAYTNPTVGMAIE